MWTGYVVAWRLVSAQVVCEASDQRVVGVPAQGPAGWSADQPAASDLLPLLRASEAQFRAVVANIPGAVYRCACNENWEIRFMSDHIEKIVGYPAREFIDNAVRTYGSITVLREWMRERDGQPDDPLFPTSRGRALSRDTIALLVAKHAKTARRVCPTLHNKAVSPHTLRHTAAMNLLHAGVDSTVIALWHCHESVEATQIYLAGLGGVERSSQPGRPAGIRPRREHLRAGDLTERHVPLRHASDLIPGERRQRV
jgi:Phage integrase family